MSDLPKLEYQPDDFSPKPKLNATPTPPTAPPSPEERANG